VAGNGTPSVASTSLGQVPFTGITDQTAYASIGGHVSATMQAGEYIKFTAGAGLTYDQSHFITAADACNPNFTGSVAAAGSCISNGVVTGIPNPNYHAVIDLPGRRFSSDDGTIIDLWIMGVVMF